VREATQCLIEASGYAVTAYGSAEEYLDSASVDRTACLITDVQMPGMNGIDLYRRLINDRRCIAIIFITGCCINELRTLAAEASVFGVLRKPIDV
jgi:FixJ family two-component response regulator